jgi:uncharacterized NAD(P)/FAD-binding protein YdhS
MLMDIQSEKFTIFTSSDIMQYPSWTVLPQARANYDIALVGAGISSAHTLLHYIDILGRQQRNRPVRLIVTEKSGEFWTGIPYGVKSGCDSLTISSLKEFIPQQLERERFISWLTENRDWVFAPEKYRAGALTSKWLAANSDRMSQGMWDELFIPRHVYGMYLKDCLTSAIENATKNGTIEIDFLTAEAIDIRASENRYRVELAAPSAEIASFTATTLVLAIGSPPNVSFDRDRVSEDDLCYIENMYEPSVDFNIERICKSLQQSDRPTHRQVLMVGSNAGTLDALYCLNNSKLAASLIDKFIVLSPNAAFPHRISRDVVAIDYVPAHLKALIATESFTARQILAAVERDVAAATAAQINISDIYAHISSAVIQALNLLDLSEQQLFVSKYAVEIGKLQRRAGGEYLDVVDSLVERDKLIFIKGKFSKYIAGTNAASGCEYIDSKTQSPTTIDAPIGVVINCAGFQDVTRSSSLLIQNLIRRGICKPNDSKRGFTIDRNFEANKNCYLMGPLVAGNIDGDFKVWHAESCQRIIGLSKHLAEVLVARSTPQANPVVTANIAFPETENVDTLLVA